ncbi:MAG: T9SS type A sorting domain-containing protein [Saprospiraceae bacterium]
MYYRLKQIDYDGKYEYSNIVNIQIIEQLSNPTIKVFPNPVSDFITIENTAAGEIVQIINLNGQVIFEFKTQSPITNQPITNLPTGTYFLKIGQETQTIIIQR